VAPLLLVLMVLLNEVKLVERCAKK